MSEPRQPQQRSPVSFPGAANLLRLADAWVWCRICANWTIRTKVIRRRETAFQGPVSDFVDFEAPRQPPGLHQVGTRPFFTASQHHRHTDSRRAKTRTRGIVVTRTRTTPPRELSHSASLQRIFSGAEPPCPSRPEREPPIRLPTIGLPPDRPSFVAATTTTPHLPPPIYTHSYLGHSSVSLQDPSAHRSLQSDSDLPPSTMLQSHGAPRDHGLCRALQHAPLPPARH